jgi:hypothetical protein
LGGRVDFVLPYVCMLTPSCLRSSKQAAKEADDE